MTLLLRGGSVRGSRADVLVDGGAIVSVGEAARAAETIDLDGAELLPGFVDTHTHLGWAGAALWRVSWDGLAARAALLAEVRRARRHVLPGFWLLGGGSTGVPDLPALAELDEATSGAPAFLVAEDRQMALVNSEAIRLLHLDEQSGVELDGCVIRGAAAWSMATDGAVPPPDRHRRRAELATALAELPRHGITQVHDIATFPGEVEPPLVYWERSYTDATLFDELELPARIFVRPSLHRRGEFLGSLGRRRIDGLKLFAMGGSGRRPEGVTFRYPGRATASKWLIEADRAGVPVSVHALRAADVAETLSLFETLTDPGRVPHRLVHAYEIAPGDVERIARLGLVVEAQPYDTAEAGYRGPWRALIDVGVSVEFGSDWRNADLDALNPLVGVEHAVAGGLTREEALRAYTRGSVEPGAPADLVALAGDEIVLTLCDGRVTYRR